MDHRRELQLSRVARRFLELRTEVPSLCESRLGRDGAPERQRVPCCPDAYPMNLNLLTSGFQGAEPLGRFLQSRRAASDKAGGKEMVAEITAGDDGDVEISTR